MTQMFGTQLKCEKLRAAPPSTKTEKLLRGLHWRWRCPTLTTEQEGRVGGRERERHRLLCGRTQVCPCPPTLPPSGSQAVLISCGGPGSGGVMSEQEMNEVIVGGGGEGAE